MKTTFFYFFMLFNLLIISCLSINASSVLPSSKSSAKAADLIFLSDLAQGETFEVWVNDVPQTLESYTSIRIKKVPIPFCKIKITFKNDSLTELIQNLYLKGGMEYVYNVSQNKNNTPFLSYQSEHRGIIGTKKNHHKSKQLLALPKKTVTYSLVKADSTFIIKDFLKDESPQEGKITTGNEVLLMMSNKIEEANLTNNFLATKNEVIPQIKTKASSNQSKAAFKSIIKRAKKTPKKIVVKPTTDKFVLLETEIKASDFESEKQRLVKEYISCQAVTYSELINLLKLLEFERTRLNVAKFAYFFVQDTNNFQELEKVFDIEQTTQKWRRYVKNAQKQTGIGNGETAAN